MAELEFDKYKPLLVVGGPHDGEWHIGEGLEILKIVKQIDEPVVTSFYAYPLDRIFENIAHVYNYKLECLHTPGRIFKFYRYIDLSLEEAFEKLFQNYHPK